MFSDCGCPHGDHHTVSHAERGCWSVNSKWLDFGPSRAIFVDDSSSPDGNVSLVFSSNWRFLVAEYLMCVTYDLCSNNQLVERV